MNSPDTHSLISGEDLEAIKERLEAIEQRLEIMENDQPPLKRSRRSSSSSPSSVVDRFQDNFADVIELLKLRVRVKAEFKLLEDHDGEAATMEGAWGNKTLARVYFNVGRRMQCPLGGTHIIVPGHEKPGVCTQIFMAPASRGPGFVVGCAAHKSFRCDATMIHDGQQIPKGWCMADPEKMKALVLDDVLK